MSLERKRCINCGKKMYTAQHKPICEDCINNPKKPKNMGIIDILKEFRIK